MDPVPSVRRLRDTVPPAVEAAIGRALAKVPADRFPDAAGFAAALQRAPLSGGEARVAPRRRIALWVACAAGLALAGAISLWRHRSAPPGTAGTPIGLAVLPFRALGVAGDSGVLTVGLPDAIITRLAGVHQLRVRPTTAALKY